MRSRFEASDVRSRPRRSTPWHALSVPPDDAQALSIRRVRSRRAYLQVRRRHHARPSVRGSQSVTAGQHGQARLKTWGEALGNRIGANIRRQPWRLPASLPSSCIAGGPQARRSNGTLKLKLNLLPPETELDRKYPFAASRGGMLSCWDRPRRPRDASCADLLLSVRSDLGHPPN